MTCWENFGLTILFFIAAVAHRLSTIQKADMIYVFDQGRIVENGTHNELIHSRGRYYELVNLQSLGKNA